MTTALRMIPALAFVTACAKPATSTPPTSEPSPPAQQGTANPANPVLDAEEAYARAMPATVLVTTAWGHGTGVVVDPRGLVLTNYHVVAPGKDEDFGFSATVTFPAQHDDGSVSPGARYAAHAIKIDDKRDLALLAVQAPGKTFPALEISHDDPQPGTRVLAIGNAGVGLGWALKRCSVNAIGTLDEQVGAMLSAQREGISDEEREKAKAALVQLAADAGKQVQTDCNILPGDSGGPLVDEDHGRIVGLNVALRTAFAQFVPLGSLAFHIHAAELRDFLREIPDGPAALVPDPWVAAGGLGALSDLDADGEVDTLNYTGPCGDNLTCQVVFADLDESSFRGNKDLPSPSELQKTRAFDAELAVLKLARLPRKPSEFPMPVTDTLAWLDRDDDGSFDTLVVIDGETNATRGYKLGGPRPERDNSLDTVTFAKLGDLFTRTRLRPAVARVTAALVGGIADLGNAERIHALSAELVDSSGNGQPDTLRIGTRLDKRVLFDLDESRLVALRERMAHERVRRGPLPEEAALIPPSPRGADPRRRDGGDRIDDPGVLRSRPRRSLRFSCSRAARWTAVSPWRQQRSIATASSVRCPSTSDAGCCAPRSSPTRRARRCSRRCCPPPSPAFRSEAPTTTRARSRPPCPRARSG